MSSVTELDRLIDEGLARYGKGDLDGALLAWEEALAVDPNNAQASSYVDYVRQNYELLTSGPELPEQLSPFGVGDEDDYEIEVYPGEISAGTPQVATTDPIDEGWFLESETAPTMDMPIPPADKPKRAPTAFPAFEAGVLEPSDDGGQSYELEADEPPPPGGVSFEDSTREYQAGRPATRDMAAIARPEIRPNEFPMREVTPAFGAPMDTSTPTGFGQQLTGVKKRDHGFVRSTLPGVGTEPSRMKRPTVIPEIGMTLRTPEIPDNTNEITIDRGGPPALSSSLELDLEPLDQTPPPAPATISRGSIAAAIDAAGIEDMELGGAGASDEPPEIEITIPQQPAEEIELGFSQAVTKDIPPMQAIHMVPAGTHTRELSLPQRTPARPSEPAPNVATNPHVVNIISQPTRDLGIRPAAINIPAKRPARAVSESDEVTGQADISRLSRSPAARSSTSPPVGDPIVARAAEILAEIDLGAPADEQKDDCTRRRITALFERATAWSKSGSPSDLERAVNAIDLALDEDATSALAQKLVHRNRDTITSVMQLYLGDLARTPMLAKPLHELASAPINPRAAFLLSRVDGVLSLDEILDVSGMPRLEAYRYLCQLYLRGILR